MFDIKKQGTDLLTGAVAGVVDQVVANYDADKDAASPTPIGFGKKISTYYNYGVPIVAVVGTGMNWFRGDMATRLTTIGGQLAARKITQQVTKRTLVKSPAAWNRAARESSMRSPANYQVQNVSDILV